MTRSGSSGSSDAQTVARVAVDDREVDLVLVGVEVEEQLLHLVHHLGDARVAAVDLVDHEDDGQARLEGLAQHEAGLGQRALAGVDEQEHAVDHGEAALDLAAEVGVAGGVDDVDLHVAVADRGVLGQDRDALLALEVHRVHDPVGDLLVRAEGAGLAQHGVDERGLAVVDVGDDGDVAEAAGQCAKTWEIAPDERDERCGGDPIYPYTGRSAGGGLHRAPRRATVRASIAVSQAPTIATSTPGSTTTMSEPTIWSSTWRSELL